MEGLLSAHLIIAITCFFGKKTSKTHLVNPKKILWYYRFFSFQQRDTNFSNYNVLKSVNLQFNMVGRWDDDMIVPPSDGPMIIWIGWE